MNRLRDLFFLILRVYLDRTVLLRYMRSSGYDFGVYEESFCAVGTQGAFQLRHAKKYKLWEHTL